MTGSVIEQRNSLMKTSVMKKIGGVLAVLLLSTPVLADKRLDDAVARAEDQIQKGRTDEALKTMQKAVSQQPTSSEAYLALGRVQRRVGSLDDAAASVAKAVEMSATAGGAVRAEALAALSAMDLLRGSGKDALAHAEQAVQVQATPASLAALTRAQARVQGGTAALQTADRAVAAGASSADAHEARGEALLALGKADEAAAEFRKALEVDPKMNLARVRLASALLAQGKAAEAVAEARKATEADAKSGQAFAVLALAIVAENKNNWNDAIAQAQNGKFLNERDPFVQVAVGRVFESNDNLDQAQAAYKKALETDPGYTPARAALLSVQVRRGDTEAALVEAQKLAAEMPQSGEIQLELGRLLLRKGDFTAAMPALERAAALNPGVAEAHALLGYAYQYNRKSQEALTAYKKATELDPKNLDYRTTYGLLLGLNKHHDAGIAELKKVIATPGYKDADAYINLGWLYRNVEPKRADEAVVAYKKALELDPKNEQAALGVGWAYFYGRKWDDAVAAFNKAVQLEPKLAADANNGIAWAYFFKKDLPQAEAFQAKAKAAGRNDTKLASNIERAKKGDTHTEEGPDPSDEPPAPKVARGPDAGTLSQILLGGADAGARRKAARDLASTGSAGVPALIRAMADRDRSVREAAVSALGAIGPAAKQAAPYLRQALNAPKNDSVVMDEQQMKESMREEDYRRLIKDALAKIER
jgi:tetratricopeptide (TPR) repeat protein